MHKDQSNEGGSEQARLAGGNAAEGPRNPETLKALKARLRELTDDKRRLVHQNETLKSWLDDANQELSFLKGSVSLQLGMALVSAMRSPRDMLALPARLTRLFMNGLRRRAVRRATPNVTAAVAELANPGAKRWRHPRFADSADDGADLLLGVIAPAAVPLVSHPIPPQLAERNRATPVATPPHALPDRVADLRVAAIMDDFTYESFRNCCQLRQLTPEGWQEEIAGFKPHIVLVESAWRGDGDRWVRKIYPLSRELAELVRACREQGIPTLFWNKEDPVHFSVFLATARLFDHVFTTDIDCVSAYRRELGHDRIHLLPFACDPLSNNPIEKYARKRGFCFAGSYYSKYPERQRDFASLVDALGEAADVDIFDRNHGKDDPALEFPENYRRLIKGSLPYAEIDRAYKGYRYGININTVKQSQSMFARRVFDLLACNTVTVSNFSRGLRLLFGDLVISTDRGTEARRRLSPLLDDDAQYRKFRLQGLRKVLAEHTYEDRLAYAAAKVFGNAMRPALPKVAVLAQAADARTLRRIVAAYERQTYAAKRLALLIDDPGLAAEVPQRADIRVLDTDERLASAGEVFAGEFVACFAGSDHYGANYLLDLALATRYCAAPAICKQAYYCADAGGASELYGDGLQYSPADHVLMRAAIADSGCLGTMPVSIIAAGGQGARIDIESMSIDEFNYCRECPQDACPQCDDPVLNTGITLARLQDLAEASPKEEGAQTRNLAGWGPQELTQLFDAGTHAAGRVTVEVAAEGIAIASRLGEDANIYVYADRLVPVDALRGTDGIGRFNMLVSADLLLSVTLIYLDGEQQRIGHVIRACNSNQSVIPPKGTRYVVLGLRVQGAGLATVRALALHHVPPAIDAIAGTADRLVISRKYPAYQDLYNYSFVHGRVVGYRDQGMGADVFRFSDASLAYEEFEGVDVVSGDVGDLSLLLRSNPYRALLIHFMDEQIWSAIQPYIAETQVVVWVHGAEIQPWYRRDFNYADEDQRRRGIQRSDMRMSFWRQMLEDLPPNMHLVFVSEFLARQAMADLGVDVPSDRYSVIHNVVDDGFFSYSEKPDDQRNSILSIRPYHSAAYANDLTVKTILDLSAEPWFDQLEFRLIGDGPLFDQVTEPLRALSNVALEKRFLTRPEIKDAHSRHGVFLCPSRIDSQGVSRDEAMASGLVPVTNAVAAVTEFVDGQVGFLAAAEDWRGLADGIRALHSDPQRFQRMSRAAAAHVRAKSGRAQTLERECALLRGEADTQPIPRAVGRRRVAVYGDINMNLVDGSAIWMASLVRVLAGVEGIEVDLLLKHRLRNVITIGEALEAQSVRLIEPGRGGDTAPLKPFEAADELAAKDAERKYQAVIVRGHEVASAVAETGAFDGRLWCYLTDIPQQEAELDAGWLASLAKIANASRYILCQTTELERFLATQVPAARGKTRLLPPMVPAVPRSAVPRRTDGPLRVAYAGKFAPLWGIREMLETADRLAARGVPVEWHIYGDKIHHPADDPGFRAEVTSRLESTPTVVWHRAMPRREVLEALATMDVGWAWRSLKLEQSTLELSTKVLEYGSAGVAALMSPSATNIAVFGPDYPLYVRDATEAVARLAELAGDRARLDAIRPRVVAAAEAHAYDRIRRDNIEPLLDPVTGGA